MLRVKKKVWCFFMFHKYWFNNSPFVLFSMKRVVVQTNILTHTYSTYLFYEEIICKKCEKIKFWWTCLWRKFLCFIMLIFADWFFVHGSFLYISMLLAIRSFRINIWHTTQLYFLYFSFSFSILLCWLFRHSSNVKQ